MSRSIPYNPVLFNEFVAMVGRLFYEDTCVVLLDFFALEQRAFVESELIGLLNWKESLLMQCLNKLENQLLLEKVIESERGSKTMNMWRFNSKVILAVEFRYRTLLEKLHTDIQRSGEEDDLQCPRCNVKVDLLEAASGPRAPDDEHPLCRLCETRLTTCNSEDNRLQLEDRYNRTVRQLATLSTMLDRVRSMEVPAFSTVPYVPSAAGKEVEQNGQGSSSKDPATGKAQSESAVVRDASIPWFTDRGTARLGSSGVSKNPSPLDKALSFSGIESTGTFMTTSTFFASGSPSVETPHKRLKPSNRGRSRECCDIGDISSFPGEPNLFDDSSFTRQSNVLPHDKEDTNNIGNLEGVILDSPISTSPEVKPQFCINLRAARTETAAQPKIPRVNALKGKSANAGNSDPPPAKRLRLN